MTQIHLSLARLYSLIGAHWVSVAQSVVAQSVVAQAHKVKAVFAITFRCCQPTHKAVQRQTLLLPNLLHYAIRFLTAHPIFLND